MRKVEPGNFQLITDDVVLGQDVKIFNFVNLYGCTIGDGSKVGSFVEIQKNARGEDHRVYALALGNLGGLYQGMGAYDRAEPIYRQALEIQKKALGEKHPDYALTLGNLAVLYRDMGTDDRAEPLLRQVLAIRGCLAAE